MGDTRNEEVTNPDGFRDVAGRPDRLPIHGMFVAWAGVPTSRGPCGHLRCPMPNVQSCGPVRWCARRYKSRPGSHFCTGARPLIDKEINYEAIDDSCSFRTLGEQHGRVPHRRVLALCLELPVPPTATDCGCRGAVVCGG